MIPQETPDEPAVPNEPAPAEDIPAAPVEELRQLGGELQSESAKLLVTYQAFLEQKEEAGGEITDEDEELEELIETFGEVAAKLNGQLQGGGFFARLRKRSDTQARPQLAKRFQAVAQHGGQVDRLMAQVQPGPEVRQAWSEIRRRWQRVGALVSSLR
jgi:hypothetical protein